MLSTRLPAMRHMEPWVAIAVDAGPPGELADAHEVSASKLTPAQEPCFSVTRLSSSP